MAAPPAAAPRVALSTSAGDFVVELYVNEAPQTCHNFMELAKRGYYDGTKVSELKWREERKRRREQRDFPLPTFDSPFSFFLSLSPSLSLSLSPSLSLPPSFSSLSPPRRSHFKYLFFPFFT